MDGFEVMLECEDSPSALCDSLKAFWGDDQGGNNGGTEDGVIGGEESVLVGGHCSDVWLAE